jgi:hypothetical protein
MSNSIDKLVDEIKAWMDTNTNDTSDRITSHELREILYAAKHIRNDVAGYPEPTRTSAIMLALVCEAKMVEFTNLEYFVEMIEAYRKQIYKMLVQRLTEKL